MKSSIGSGCDDAAVECEDKDDSSLDNSSVDSVHVSPLMVMSPPRPLVSNAMHQVQGTVDHVGNFNANTGAATSPYAGTKSTCTRDEQTPALETPEILRRCHTAPWDERINWSKSKRSRRRSFRSSNSGSGSTTSGSSVSTQLLYAESESLPLRPAAMIRRNISSTSSSSSSSLSLSEYSVEDHELQLPSDDEHQQQILIESRNPIYFSPRRRLNSLAHSINRHATADTNNALSILPVAVVSIPIVTDMGASSSGHGDRTLATTPGGDESHNVYGGRWSLLFSYFQPQRNNVYQQRRNLLLLFLIATYTTFGLASPNIQMAVSNRGNVILIDDTVLAAPGESSLISGSSRSIKDGSFVVVMDDDAKRTSKSATESLVAVPQDANVIPSQLRGSSADSRNEVDSNIISRKDSSVVRSRLSFARGGGSSNSNTNHHFPNQLVYRRREVNDFYHQPALLQEETTATTSWYLNCFVLCIIAMYYVIRDHKKVILSCQNGTTQSTHHL